MSWRPNNWKPQLLDGEDWGHKIYRELTPEEKIIYEAGADAMLGTLRKIGLGDIYSRQNFGTLAVIPNDPK